MDWHGDTFNLRRAWRIPWVCTVVFLTAGLRTDEASAQMRPSVSPATTPVSSASMHSPVSSAPAQPTALDFQTVFFKVKSSSLALKRSSEIRNSAQASESSVAAQRAPTLQLSNSLSAQVTTGFKQQHALSVSTTLWDFGRQKAAELRAGAQLLLADAQMSESEEALKIRTARFYVAVCSAEEILEVAREQVRNAEQKLNTVMVGYKRGERPQSDVVRLKVELGKAQLFLKRSQDEVMWLKSQLLSTLSDNLQQLADPGTLRLKPLPSQQPNHWRNFISETGASVPETASLLRLRANKIVLESELDALRAEDSPLITGSAGIQGNGTLFPLKPDLSAQVGLQYFLPLGQVREQKKIFLLARVRENLLSLEDEIKSRSDKRLQSRLRIEGILGQIEQQKSQIDLLLEFQKLVRARYFAGRASLLELSNTEDELLANRLELTRLQSNLFSSAIDTAEALGGKSLEKIF